MLSSRVCEIFLSVEIFLAIFSCGLSYTFGNVWVTIPHFCCSSPWIHRSPLFNVKATECENVCCDLYYCFIVLFLPPRLWVSSRLCLYLVQLSNLSEASGPAQNASSRNIQGIHKQEHANLLIYISSWDRTMIF